MNKILYIHLLGLTGLVDPIMGCCFSLRAHHMGSEFHIEDIGIYRQCEFFGVRCLFGVCSVLNALSLDAGVGGTKPSKSRHVQLHVYNYK